MSSFRGRTTHEHYLVTVRQNPERPHTLLINFDPMPVLWEDVIERARDDVAEVLRKYLPGDHTYLLRVKQVREVEKKVHEYLRLLLKEWADKEYLLPPEQKGRIGTGLLFEAASR